MEKPLWQRSAIVFAGPLFNFLLAIVLIFGMTAIFGEEYLVEQATIGRVTPGSPAEKAGLTSEDQVLAINGQIIPTWKSLAEFIHASDGSEMNLTVKRGEETLALAVSPKRQEIKDPSGNLVPIFLIGIEPLFRVKPATIFRAAEVGVITSWALTTRTAAGLWDLVTGKISPKELAGPIFIVQKTSDEAQKGFKELMWFAAIISISLAVLNLLPIPVLDGGHLLFFFIEAIIGPISVRKKEIAQQVGVFALLSLMVYAIHNDLTRQDPVTEEGRKWAADQE